jgi:uncharacterized protein (DUF58 family)
MADSVLQGGSPSSIPGRGVEVAGIREYQPGDEARGIDWRVTARRGRLFVREYAEEKELPLLILLHRSPTLWAGRRGVKAVRALETSALLAVLGLKGGDSVGLCLSGVDNGRIVRPGKGRSQLPEILVALLSTSPPRAHHPMGVSLERAGFLIRQRARIFVIGDFQLPLTELDDLRRKLRILSSRHLVVPVRITDREELEWPTRGTVALRDPITKTSRPPPGSAARESLRKSLAETEEEISRLFRSLSISEWTVDVGDWLVEGLRRNLFRPRGRLDPAAPERAYGPVSRSG